MGIRQCPQKIVTSFEKQQEENDLLPKENSQQYALASLHPISSKLSSCSVEIVFSSYRISLPYFMPLLLDNIWLHFLEQVALENQKYLETNEHPFAYSLAYIKNVKLAGVHPQKHSAHKPKRDTSFPLGMYFRFEGLEKRGKFLKYQHCQGHSVCKWTCCPKFYCSTTKTVSVQATWGFTHTYYHHQRHCNMIRNLFVFFKPRMPAG